MVVKVFDAIATRVAAGSKSGERLLERGAVDVGDDRRLVAAGAAAERVDQQMRAQRRAADAEMEDVADRAERLRLDRVDQRAHPRVQAGGAGDALGRALARARRCARRRGLRSG